MSVKVIIPTPLRPYADKRESVQFEAKTVAEALDRLTKQYVELRKHLYTDDGKIRSFVNVYVNDEDIRYLLKENTPTKDGDTISIVPSIAGGSASIAVAQLRNCFRLKCAFNLKRLGSIEGIRWRQSFIL
ncbi:MAG TPA: MoaD/ThiS family protein [Candidatus Dormibacteraeota bacterium]|nr:MoaD/ThiS family protein [Candidatus Dormibacteraeota bacterium]